MDTLKKQLDIAQKKLAFYQEKKLLGGLSLDQEFKLEEDIMELETLISNLKQQIGTSNSNNNQNKKPNIHQTH